MQSLQTALETVLTVGQIVWMIIICVINCVCCVFRSIRYLFNIAIQHRGDARDLTAAVSILTQRCYVITRSDEVKKVAREISMLLRKSETEDAILACFDVMKALARLIRPRHGPQVQHQHSMTTMEQSHIANSIDEGVACLRYVERISHHITAAEDKILKRMARQRNEELIVLYRAYGSSTNAMDVAEFVLQAKDLLQLNVWSKSRIQSQ